MHYALGLLLLLGGFLQSFHTLPWKAAHSEAFSFLAVLVWGWGAARRNAPAARLTTPVMALLSVGLLIAMQYATGHLVFAGDAVIFLLYIQLCIVTLLIAQWHGNDVHWPTILAGALLSTALASALIALIQALGVWTDSGWILQSPGYRRPGANFGQANQLGTLLVMGAASLIYLHQRLSISRSVVMLLSFILLIGMGITESRTGLLSGITLCLWWFARRRVFAHPVQWPWVVAGAVALITIMWMWPPFISQIHEAGPLPKEVTINTAAGIRLTVWQQLWEAAWIKPWLGWGLRGVSTALNAVLQDHPISSPFTYAHNIFLDMAIGMGLPLTVFALCATGLWVWRRVSAVHTVTSWYAVGLLIPFAVHCLFEYPFAYAYFLVPAMLAIGMLQQGHAIASGKILSRNVIFGSLIIFGSVFSWVCIEYINIEEDFSIARFESLNLGQTPADYKQPHIVLLTQLKAMVAATRTTPKPNMSPEEIDLLRVTTLRFSWVPVQNTYALALALNDNPQEALRQLKVLRAMHGEKVYEGIKANWTELATTKYPPLKALALP